MSINIGTTQYGALTGSPGTVNYFSFPVSASQNRILFLQLFGRGASQRLQWSASGVIPTYNNVTMSLLSSLHRNYLTLWHSQEIYFALDNSLPATASSNYLALTVITGTSVSGYNAFVVNSAFQTGSFVFATASAASVGVTPPMPTLTLYPSASSGIVFNVGSILNTTDLTMTTGSATQLVINNIGTAEVAGVEYVNYSSAAPSASSYWDYLFSARAYHEYVFAVNDYDSFYDVGWFGADF
jgi:hypothetical protein